jgi:hypothetical protein
MATVRSEYTTEDQRSVVLRDSMQRKFSRGRSKTSDDETEVRKWLRQQSKDFYAVGFDALVKRWDKCISVGGGYVEK